MPYVICRDCKKPAEVKKLAKGKGFYTKNLKDGCQCGTDQRRGKVRQEWLASNMKDSLAELAYKPPAKDEPDPKPKASKPSKQSKLWWLLAPVVGLGWLAAKTLNQGKSQ